MLTWDAVKSAGSAASFAALLAAIVLSIIVQLGVAPARSSASHWMTTRRFGPICLVTLLAAAYMFVLLSGMPSPTDPAAILPAAQHASYLFGIAGSTLAVGALSTLALILIMFREGRADGTPGDTDDRVGHSAAATLVGGVVIAALFLVFGYDDIFAVFNSAGDFSLLLWGLHISVLFGPIVVALLLRQMSKVKKVATWIDAIDRPGSGWTWLAGAWLFVVPTASFLCAAHFLHPSSSLQAGLSTTVFALWSGLSMGGILCFALSIPVGTSVAPEKAETQPQA
ncbi:hypothetical protein AB0J55_17475 [Amycolatopsis sp. NPDC049688]|uniref:hypothetical protein n=1 Tax=Amycolatopsis sp. NPDC049688 TaxID=3154733 RepID=UPI00344666A2